MSSYWGPSTWNILHILAHNIDDDFYSNNYNRVFSVILDIFHSLPCRVCLSFSNKYLKNNSLVPSDKKLLISFLFHFHNAVNSKLSKNVFSFDDLDNTYNLCSSDIIYHFNFFQSRFLGVRGYDLFCDMNKSNAVERLRVLMKDARLL